MGPFTARSLSGSAKQSPAGASFSATAKRHEPQPWERKAPQAAAVSKTAAKASGTPRAGVAVGQLAASVRQRLNHSDGVQPTQSRLQSVITVPFRLQVREFCCGYGRHILRD